jgi:hypothetical protein
MRRFVPKNSWLVLVCVIVLPASTWAANVVVDCSGVTPGAFTSLQAAIDSLDQAGPNQITVVTNPCLENVQIVDRQRLTIIAPNGNFFTSQVGPDGDVMTISGSTGITLTLLGFTGGSRGLVINRASEVSIHGSTVQANAAAGIRVEGNSTVSFDGLIQSNGGAGMNVNDSTLTLGGAQILNNGAAGVALTRSHAQFEGNTFQGNTGAGLSIGNGSSAQFLPTNLIQNNNNGVNISNSSSVQFFAPNLIQSNHNIGVQVGDGSSARFLGDVAPDGSPLANVISGNPWIGINTFGAHVLLSGATQITNNGFGGQPFHAGVRVDDNTDFVSEGSGDIEISNNTGPGIAAIAGGNIDMSGTVIKYNSEDGINLAGNTQVVFFPPNTNVLMGNGKLGINCDNTSVFLGDKTGVGKLACQVSQLGSGSAARATRRLLRDSGRD